MTSYELRGGCRLRFHCARTAQTGALTPWVSSLRKVKISQKYTSQRAERQTDAAVLLVEAVDLIDSLYLDTKRTLKVVAEFIISGKVKLKGKLFVN